MKNKLFIISNESISSNNDENFCDNIDLKSIPEELNNFFDVTLIARKSNHTRSKKINLKNIFLSNNIIYFLFLIIRSFKEKNSKYLIISLSPYTFLGSLLLKIFSKQHFLYLRSDGFEEYRAIFGTVGVIIYKIFFFIGTINANLIACREHLLKRKKGTVVQPSQLNEKWIQNRETKPIKTNLLYVGRLRIEKGIFSLIKMLKNKNLSLTIVTSEKEVKLKDNYKNISLISFENKNDSIIKIYDEYNILILPSYTEAHPQVLDEALARCRPVIIFKEIEHVKRDRLGVFVCERNFESLNNKINHILNNYQNIFNEIKMNKLPTKKNFINQLKEIIVTK